MDMICIAGLLANPFEALGLEWQSIVLHLFNLIILTVGLYLLLFKPVKRMIKERQDKIRKIEKENADLNEEVKKMKESSEIVLADARKEAAVIHENAVKVANQKADEIVQGARRQAKGMIDRTEQELETNIFQASSIAQKHNCQLIRLDWHADDFTVTFQHDIPFEDKSGMRFMNFPDGVNTLNFSFRNRDRWVTDILLEYVYTKWQSGPYHDTTADPDRKDEPYTILGGNDNYFNNGEYKSGWTYYGRTIGLPLLTPMPVTETSDGKVFGVCNTRVSAWHFGIRGKAARLVPYKFLFTYSRNFGQYSQRDLTTGNSGTNIFKSVPEQFSLALECEVPRLGKETPLSLGIGLYGDFGQMYQDSFGITVRLTYAEKRVFGKR